MLDNNKERFLETREKDGDFYRAKFKEAETSEIKFKKDLSNFDVSEIIDFYNSLFVNSFTYLRSINSKLSMYSSWCVDNDISEVNNFKNMKAETIMDCINRKETQILTRSQLHYFLSLLNNPRDRFVILALFEGLSGKDFKEIWSLSEEDVDYSSGLLKLSTGREIKVSKDLLNVIKDAIKTIDYIPQSGNKGVVELKPSKLAFKDYLNSSEDTSEFQKGRNVYMVCKRFRTNFGLESLTPKNISDSGKIDLILTKYKKFKNEMSIREFATGDFFDEINEQYGTKTSKYAFYKQYGEYLERNS